MQVHANNYSNLVVLAQNRVLASSALRDLLDEEGVSAIALGDGQGSSLEERTLRVANEIESSWKILLLSSSDDSNYRDTVPRLMAAGLDDVVVASGDAGISALAHSLQRGRATLELCTAVKQTGRIIGNSPPMQAVRKAAAQCIQSQTLPVLIFGETGTGKSQIAKAMHEADPLRKKQPFHTLDCGGVTDSLLGSELFGHVRGAFTGALNNRRGAMESAEEGTLFLDEIGELTLPAQSYLLNALQERKYRPVGSDHVLAVRCRFVAATNRSLIEDVENRRFRRDLFYRMNGSCIQMPALRDHPADIAELFTHFLEAARKDAPKPDIEPAVVQFLQSREYPGNVRELESIAQQTAIRMGDERSVRLAHLPVERMLASQSDNSSETSVESMVRQGMQLRDIESEVARQAARAALMLWTERQPDTPRTQVVKQVARSLGVSARTIYNKLNGVERLS